VSQKAKAGEAAAFKSPLGPGGQNAARGMLLSPEAIKALKAARRHQFITIGDVVEGDKALGPYVFAKLKSSPNFIRLRVTEQTVIDLERTGLIRTLTGNPHDNRYIITPKGLKLLKQMHYGLKQSA
jgi:predicted transcriptional regulator